MRTSIRISQAQEIEKRLVSLLPKWRDSDGLLPSETELSGEFGVSRVTIREALAALERRGLIVRRQGLGTFVNRRAASIQTRLEESVEFGDMIRASGYEAGMQVLEWGVATASEDSAARLLIQPGTELIRIRKVFTADRRPVIYCINLIPLDLVPREQQESLRSLLDPSLPVYSILYRWFQQTVDYQISDAEACSATPELAEILDCSPQTPLFRINEIGYNLQQHPLFSGDTHFVPGVIQFRLVRKPIFTIP